MKTLFKEHWLFIAILLSAIVLRFIPLFEYQFTYDEWSGLFRTQFNSFGELIDKGIKIDAHPAFVQVLIYYLSKVFGYTDWIIKLPFLLFSVGAVVYAYCFCVRNFSKQSAIFAAVIFSYSLVFVYYAPIARMYISGIFFSLGLIYHFGEIFFLNNTRTKHFVLFGLFALLCALNQHLNALFAFTLCAAGFLYTGKNTLKPFLITCIVTVSLYLPHLPVTLYQLGLGGIGFEQGGWLPIPKIYDLFEFIKIILGTGRSYIIIGGIILISFILNRQPHLNKMRLLFVVLFLLNFFIVFFYSVFRAPVYQHSAMLFAGTGLLLAITSAFNFKNNLFFHTSILLIICTLLFKTYYKKDYLHQCVKNIFEYQFERTTELKNKYGDKLVYPVFFDADTFIKKICFEKYNSNYKCSITGNEEVSNIKSFGNLVSSLNTKYLVLASSFPNYQAVAKEYYPYLVEFTQTQGLYYKVYSKDPADKTRTVGEDNILCFSNPGKPMTFKYSKEIFQNNTTNLIVDSLTEFPFSATAPLNEISSKEGQVILLKAELKLKTLNPKNIFACLSANDIVGDSTYSYNAASATDFITRNDSTVTIYTAMYCGTNYKTIKDKSKLTAYLWNRDKVNFTLVNFEIVTIDYWPQKWNYWK